jgi:hypothetical protein
MTHDRATICLPWISTEFRSEALLAVARSIKVAHQAGPDRWGLRLDVDSLMLKVGPHEVLQVLNCKRAKRGLPFHVIVDRDLIPATLRSRDDLWFSKDEDCYENLGRSSYYSSDPGTEACEFKFSVLKEGLYDALFAAHTAVIHRVAHLPLNPATRQKHSRALVEFLALETGHSLAQPTWTMMHEK